MIIHKYIHTHAYEVYTNLYAICLYLMVTETRSYVELKIIKILTTKNTGKKKKRLYENEKTASKYLEVIMNTVKWDSTNVY